MTEGSRKQSQTAAPGSLAHLSLAAQAAHQRLTRVLDWARDHEVPELIEDDLLDTLDQLWGFCIPMWDLSGRATAAHQGAHREVG